MVEVQLLGNLQPVDRETGGPDRGAAGPQQVETATAGWVHWFNTRRLHSSIDYRPPVTYEQLYRQQTSTPTGKAA